MKSFICSHQAVSGRSRKYLIIYCPERADFLRFVYVLQLPFNWKMGQKFDANPFVENTLHIFLEGKYVRPNKRQRSP